QLAIAHQRRQPPAQRLEAVLGAQPQGVRNALGLQRLAKVLEELQDRLAAGDRVLVARRLALGVRIEALALAAAAGAGAGRALLAALGALSSVLAGTLACLLVRSLPAPAAARRIQALRQ